MADAWARLLTRWIEAGLVDGETAARIRAFELQHGGSTRLRWPIWLAMAFGALMLGAGTLLFVSAHWDEVSPTARFALVTLLVAVFHVAGAAVSERFPGMATTLHALGTVALGAGIFLAGQIFNLDEHWPGGLMLWTLGAAIGWAVLGEWPQMALLAILGPAWLCGEWLVATEGSFYPRGARIAACGSFLLALAYFTAIRAERADVRRRVLLWVGAISLVPSAISLVFATEGETFFGRPDPTPLPNGLWALGWSVALGLPFVVALAMRGAAAWSQVVATFWVLALLRLRPVAGDVSLYAWWALGAVALALWGVREARSERINTGSVIFFVTVMTFYFSHVMDKLERSASLIGFGLVFLAGGWALERVRRHLVLQTRGGQA